MRLLDTHAFLWFISGESKLTEIARHAIQDPPNQAFVSIGSLWEIAIKVSIGKLILTEPFTQLMTFQLASNSITVLPMKLEHVAKLVDLPMHHCDPFDRLLVAQSLVERIPLISSDKQLDVYGLQRIG